MKPKALSDYIIENSEGRKRYIVAIAGPPGAGKSTFSQALLLMLKEKSIQAKIDDTFKEASTLLKKDKEHSINELSKLIKVADGDLDILKNTIKKLKTSIKF